MSGWKLNCCLRYSVHELVTTFNLREVFQNVFAFFFSTNCGEDGTTPFEAEVNGRLAYSTSSGMNKDRMVWFNFPYLCSELY